MEAKETYFKTLKQYNRIEDTEYYKYIFKKTEKIVCAVFYVLRHNEKNVSETIKNIVESQAQILLNAVLESLKDATPHALETAYTIRYELAALESKLRVATAAQVLDPDFMAVFATEIDSVQRSLKRYLEPKLENPLFTTDQVSARVPLSPRRERKSSVSVHEGPKALGVSVTPEGKSRRERVLDVLREKGEATIKDITDTVTDCSEKTIQRELIGLIKDNIIVREGERRWSKYKLI